MALINELVSYILQSRYEDLPRQVVEVAKKSVLDTLAATIAGSSAEGLEQLVNLAKGWGGREEAHILIYGDKIPAPTAALVNSTMARARDLDDTHELCAVHPNATIVPSAFIISEYSKMLKGRMINGKEFILAIALGSEFFCRLRFAAGKGPQDRGFLSETFAPIPVAAMGGKMLGFDEITTLNAMGIAYAQCPGNSQAHIEGALTVRLQQGLGAQAGILSIMLADQGFTGAKDILEGKYGIYSVYGDGQYTPEVLTPEELDKHLYCSTVSTKAYPCGRHTHAAICGALQLAEEHKITDDNIEKVTISTSSRAYDMCGSGERKVVPQTVPDAQFSYYYTVATALVKGRLLIEDFVEEAIGNPQVLAMARKIKVVVDPEKSNLKGVAGGICPIDIEIESKDGKHYKKHVEFARGSPKNPMDWAEIIQKLEDCARFSAKPLPDKNIDNIIQMVADLDKLDDVTTILEYLG
ncbi:MmgE/PrpD family protein [Chloroflexota bacterium]